MLRNAYGERRRDELETRQKIEDVAPVAARVINADLLNDILHSSGVPAHSVTCLHHIRPRYDISSRTVHAVRRAGAAFRAGSVNRCTPQPRGLSAHQTGVRPVDLIDPTQCTKQGMYKRTAGSLALTFRNSDRTRPVSFRNNSATAAPLPPPCPVPCASPSTNASASDSPPARAWRWCRPLWYLITSSTMVSTAYSLSITGLRSTVT